MIEAFRTYHTAGLACLPAKLDKSPDVRGTWRGGILDSADYKRAEGIGIICGQLSGGLECMDFDNHFGDAKEIISDFSRIQEVKELFEKYTFPVQATKSGGYHLLYLCSTVGGNQKLASRPKKEGDRWRPDAIIETRGEGGYFCAAPTPGYRVIRGDIASPPEISPEEREILLSAARSFHAWDDTPKNEFEQGDRPGDVFNNKPEAADEALSALLSAGWKEISQGVLQRPGKDKGISATFGRIAPGIFYNFSANGFPFAENAAFTPFQVISLLKHNGDFSAFARELSERYELNNQSRSNVHDRSGNSRSEKKQDSQFTRDLKGILERSFIDLTIPVEKPPVIMRIRDYEATRSVDRRLFTLGNFSAITGKSKSKKTFLTSLILAAAADNTSIQNKLIPDLPENKQAVLLFDTEQSRYDSYVTSARIPKLLGHIPENFGAFDLREYSPRERCEIIEFGLQKWRDNLGLVVIDGIADLAEAINDEEIASRIVSMLMRWTKVYNCHIVTVIHQNKGDSYATGHLGSAILKKAEAIISVTRDEGDSRKSRVSCDLIRGVASFEDFEFRIDDEGMPQVEKLSQTEYVNYMEPQRDEF